MSDTPPIFCKKSWPARLRKSPSAAAAQPARSAPPAENAPPPRPFRDRLEYIAPGQAAVIAEIKRASPSKGLLRDPFLPADIARSYAAAGAAGLSVLTDRDFFQGGEDICKRRGRFAPAGVAQGFHHRSVPGLRSAADRRGCILLIVAALDQTLLYRRWRNWRWICGWTCWWKCTTPGNWIERWRLDAPLIGVNNRNLRTFETRLETTLNLLAHLPGGCTVVTESGIHTPDDVALMRQHGVHAFLVGEAFMRAPDPILAESFGRRSVHSAEIKPPRRATPADPERYWFTGAKS
jgi:indole-3-glycerol phosphate synthase